MVNTFFSLNLHQFRDIFGEPNTGVHKYRFFNIAIVDVVSVFIVGYIIYLYTGYSLINTLVILFIIGIIAHRMFGVRTQVDQILFP